MSGSVTAIHASEFSVSSDEGFAGTADALIDTPLGLTICDFKTTSRETDKPEAWLKGPPGPARRLQLGLRERAGIRVNAGAVVIAKPNGNVQLRMLSELEMRGCEARWTERNNLYKEMLLSGEVM